MEILVCSCKNFPLLRFVSVTKHGSKWFPYCLSILQLNPVLQFMHFLKSRSAHLFVAQHTSKSESLLHVGLLGVSHGGSQWCGWPREIEIELYELMFFLIKHLTMIWFDQFQHAMKWPACQSDGEFEELGQCPSLYRNYTYREWS